ncbi:MAG: hypothetical protein QN141_04725 [Armatimonadota bacterium]|nr:hypothetical protein [Armatimonadota bacterium]MDR7466880.1 hypothetical protein [Armatimonadota bacterium]MDR7492647.1 hypothetical protein [Armatimonadota bacterium]MDR7504202.1 hypothetical protein [Armatimonadota bacterium]MDR7546901.1 hypothetical protein [Armatimonadota bacterium]
MAVLLCAVGMAAGCSRPTPAFVEYQDDAAGFSLRLPAGWVRRTAGPGEARFTPPEADTGAEFLSVFTVPSPDGRSESSIRRIVFSLLPIYGVSGFQQDPRTSDEILWFKFEVTGSSDGVEWASVGVAAAGAARTQVAVCAKPLPRWRDGQKECDNAIRSFRPGPLGPP